MLIIPQPTNMWDGHCASMGETWAELEDEDAISMVKVHVRGESKNCLRNSRKEGSGGREEAKESTSLPLNLVCDL